MHGTSQSAPRLGVVVYLVAAYLLCNGGVGDAALTAAYHAQTPQEAYTWPLVAFGTAFSLNFLTLLFERDSAKTQLALIACYINFLAGLSDFLAWKGVTPVMLDVWGGGLAIMRILMWLLTTPAMVYLLSLISDFNSMRVTKAVAADVFMIVFGIAAHLSQNLLVGAPIYVLAFTIYAFVISEMWQMFDAPISDALNESSRQSLRVLRFCTVGFWFSIPIAFIIIKAGLVSIGTEEWLWTLADFLGKVTFSSSLLYGNFLTIEQRRLITMRIVEESNRIKVIQELKDLVDQKDHFMSSMSHELRTPLNGIIGLSDCLMSGSCGDMSEQVQKTIGTIKTSGSRLLNLINDILDAASMRMGKLVIKQEKVILTKVVDDVVLLCQTLAKKGVQVVNGVNPNLPAILGDSSRIIQIFHNLIGNSCKFTHNGFITIAAEVKGEDVEVSVVDTGIGIPESRFEKIFEAFEQVDMSTTRKYGGTGLGLNLVKQLVEAHGGTISVKSVMGSGTTFTFKLKCWENSPEALEAGEPGVVPRMRRSLSYSGSSVSSLMAVSKTNPSGSQAQSRPSFDAVGREADFDRLLLEGLPDSPTPLAHAGTKAKAGKARQPGGDKGSAFRGLRRRSFTKKGGKIIVLSVDDDPVNQMVVQSLLGPEGYEVIQAMDGAEALEALEKSENLPDVILLDVMMPGMSGYEVCRKLKEQILYKCIPVIMVSAKGKEDNIVEGLTSGSSDYLVKPFGRKEILARIASHVRFRNDVYSAGLEDGVNDDNLVSVEEVAAEGILDSSPDHEKQILENQLEEVSEECARLQDLVDALELKLGQQALAFTAQEDVVSDLKAKNTELKSRAQLVEGQMQQMSDREKLVEGQLEEAEGQLMAVQQLKRALELDLRHAMHQISELEGQYHGLVASQRRVAGSSSTSKLGPQVPPTDAASPTFGKQPRSPLQDALAPPSPGSFASRLSASPGGLRAPLAGLRANSVKRHSSMLMLRQTQDQQIRSSFTGIGGERFSRSSSIDPADQEGMPAELTALLVQAGLEHLVVRFVAEEIMPPMIPHLSDEELMALGVTSLGARIRLRALASGAAVAEALGDPGC